MVRRQRLTRQLGAAGNHGDEVVKVMRNPPGQPPDAFHPLRAPQLLLKLSLLGDVGRDTNHTPHMHTDWLDVYLFIKPADHPVTLATTKRCAVVSLSAANCGHRNRIRELLVFRESMAIPCIGIRLTRQQVKWHKCLCCRLIKHTSVPMHEPFPVRINNRAIPQQAARVGGQVTNLFFVALALADVFCDYECSRASLKGQAMCAHLYGDDCAVFAAMTPLTDN